MFKLGTETTSAFIPAPPTRGYGMSVSREGRVIRLTWEQRVDKWIRDNNPTQHPDGGVLLVGPNGIGKSHFVGQNRDWVDGDALCQGVGAMPAAGSEWKNWTQILTDCDAVLKVAKDRGLRVLSSTWWDLAIFDGVIWVDKETHKRRLENKANSFPAEFWTEDTLPAREALYRAAATRTRPWPLRLTKMDAIVKRWPSSQTAKPSPI